MSEADLLLFPVVVGKLKLNVLKDYFKGIFYPTFYNVVFSPYKVTFFFFSLSTYNKVT